MVSLLPYFAGLVTLLLIFGFALEIKEITNDEE